MGLSQNVEAALDWNIMENSKKYDAGKAEWLEPVTDEAYDRLEESE